jgi:uncharacterized beta-barrel protein YwiB (DUF1934 family)
MSVEALIRVVGIQHIDGKSDKTELITDGTFETAEDGFLIRYQETAATGMAGTDTTLQVQPEKVTLQRRGTAAGMLMLEHKKRHQCSYATPYGNLMLGVFTQRMQQNLSENGGVLEVSYTLDMGGDMVSQQDLTVTVTPKNS